MLWPFRDKEETRYWLKVFAFYTLMEAFIQLLFLVTLNYFGDNRISIPEYHLVMLFFQCLLIWPIWWVAWLVRRKTILVQVAVNLAFYVAYSFFWFGPVQDIIEGLYNQFQGLTRPLHDRQAAYLDRGYDYSFLSYQLLKHAFRLSWFYLANYFYNYRLEEKQRIGLALFNRELQMKLLKWHLNPSFYFRTIAYLQQSAAIRPSHATQPILQLAKVMEYVIYDARAPQLSMQKEISFLENYTGLLNQQTGEKPGILLKIVGDAGRLGIAPLLLTGVVDAIRDQQAARQCELTLQFSGRELMVSVPGLPGKPQLPPLLEELYKDRYSTEYSTNQLFTIRLQLDELS